MPHNNIGVLNMSGLIDYLMRILPYKAVLLGDGIFSNSSVLWNTKTPADATDDVKKFFRRSRSVRQPIELNYGSFFNLLRLFCCRDQLKLFQDTKFAKKTMVMGFFVFNCHTSLNGSATNSFFNTTPPTLNEYIPI